MNDRPEYRIVNTLLTVPLLGAFLLLVLSLVGCDDPLSVPPASFVEIVSTEITPDGTEGEARIVGEIDGKGRLVLTLNTHVVLLDTTVLNRFSAFSEFETVEGYGHPPMPFGDCWTVEVEAYDGRVTDEVCSTDRLP